MEITIKNNDTNGSPNYCYYIAGISEYPWEKEILFSSHCYFSVSKIKRHRDAYDYVCLICHGCYLNKKK